VSTNGGVSFTTVATGLPASAQFKTIAGKEGHIWLATNTTGLWRSTNSGASFTQVTSVVEAETFGAGKSAPGQTYPALFISGKVGTIKGIYRSDDEGATWVRINDDAHQYAWTGKAITGDPRIYGRVYIATNGRGIICGDINTTGARLANGEEEESSEMISILPNPVTGNEIRFQYHGEVKLPLQVRVTDLSGRQLHAQELTNVVKSATHVIKPVQKMKQGLYILNITSDGQRHAKKFVVE
jgi:hypothetical protein